MQFATNHLGHFALALGLHDALAADGAARIVSVSSSGHLRSPVVFDDIDFRVPRVRPVRRLRAVQDRERPVRGRGDRALGGDGITANALMPGGIAHQPAAPHGPGLHPAADAETGGVHASRPSSRAPRRRSCSRPRRSLEGIGGRYFEDCNEAEVVAERHPEHAPAASRRTRSTPTARTGSGRPRCGSSAEPSRPRPGTDRAGGYGAAVLTLARREPSAVLFAAQLAGLLVYPAMEGNQVGQALFSVLGIAILGLVVLRRPQLAGVDVGRRRARGPRQRPAAHPDRDRQQRPAAVVVGVRGAALLLRRRRAHRVHARRPRDHPRRAVRRRRDVHARRVGVRVSRTSSARRSRRAASPPRSTRPAPRTWVELLFLSFTTLSSTGLSDVVPIRPFARSLVMFEQLAGIAYVAMVVSRLVGLTVMRGTQRP